MKLLHSSTNSVYGQPHKHSMMQQSSNCYIQVHLGKMCFITLPETNTSLSVSVKHLNKYQVTHPNRFKCSISLVDKTRKGMREISVVLTLDFKVKYFKFKLMPETLEQF